MTGVCETCGGPLPPQKRGRRRRFCSDRCRKAQYDLVCVDCGGRVNGSSPAGMANRDEPRCIACAARHSGEARRVWTRTLIIERIREWAAMYGEPPAVPDWVPWQARNAMHDEERARRAESGYWPSPCTVVRLFGSWNAGIEAAGFTPREAHGGGDNVRRRRRRRVAA